MHHGGLCLTKKITRCTSRSAALTAMNCLPTKNHTRAHNGTRSKEPVYRSNGRIALKIHRQKTSNHRQDRKAAMSSSVMSIWTRPHSEHQHCQTREKTRGVTHVCKQSPLFATVTQRIETVNFFIHVAQNQLTGLKDTLRPFCEPLILHQPTPQPIRAR